MIAKPPVPILRSFDEAKAREFYVDFLGFKIVFEHRFGKDAPLYMGVALGACELHLSEHHGDGTPGTYLRIEIDDVEGYCRTLNTKNYKNSKPGIMNQDWGFKEMSIADPAGNKLIFCTPKDA